MTIHALPHPQSPPDLAQEDLISQTRGCFLASLTDGISALESSALLLTLLRGPELADAELVAGRDGRDLATMLDDCIRHGRAAYAVMHAVIDQETP
jgi:hypothetical protein